MKKMKNTVNICDPDEWILGRFCEYKVFNKKELKNVCSWAKKQGWKDGLKSLHWDNTGNAHDLKRNQETIDRVPDDLLWPYINRSKKFMEFACPSTSSGPLCTRTSVGGYYKPHFDVVHTDQSLPQFSTTIFLSDPDEYEGGELVLWIDGKEVFFKPKAGRAVTYETGIGHRVNTVTSGERLAIIFWTYSEWKDLDIFDEWKYYKLMSKYTKHHDRIVGTLDEFYNLPHNIFRQKANRYKHRGGGKKML